MDEKTLLGAIAEAFDLWDGQGDCPLELAKVPKLVGTWRIEYVLPTGRGQLVKVNGCLTRDAALTALEAWYQDFTKEPAGEPRIERTTRYSVALYKDGNLVTCPVCREHAVIGGVGSLWFRCGGKSCGAEYDMRKEDR